MKCKVHPKYKGKGKPFSLNKECICHKIWLARQSRVPHLPTKVFKSKKVYNRQKNKKIEEES